MSCQEETVQARGGKVAARDADWGKAKGKGEVAWAVRFRPARAGFAYVRGAGTKQPMAPDSLALRERVRSVADR
jgi:hypothetical protein